MKSSGLNKEPWKTPHEISFEIHSCPWTETNIPTVYNWSSVALAILSINVNTACEVECFSFKLGVWKKY